MNWSFGIALLETTGDVGLMSMLPSLVVVGGIVVLMYFLMIRPQRKKEKQATEMRNSIEVGDEVVTIGGIVGRVVSLKEDTFVLETAGERSRMRFKRWAIQDVGKLSLDTGEPEAKAGADKGKAEKAKPEKSKTKE